MIPTIRMRLGSSINGFAQYVRCSSKKRSSPFATRCLTAEARLSGQNATIIDDNVMIILKISMLRFSQPNDRFVLVSDPKLSQVISVGCA